MTKSLLSLVQFAAISLSLAIPVTILLTIPSTVFGQEDGPDQVVEFVDRYEAQYRSQPPNLGTVIGSIPAFNADGKQFDMSQIKGKYSVFVFGCLT